MITITLPKHRARAGHIAGVAFTDGVGTVKRLSSAKRTYFGLIGADITESTPLPEMKVAELRSLADERGVDVPKTAKKADIIDALEAETE